MLVLVIDDDEAIRDFIAVALIDEGYAVLTAPHGAAALGLIEQSPPDLILLDMRMPVMDGWQFARAYRQMPGPHAPVIVLTAGRSAAEAAAAIGAAGFLPKPFELDQLYDLLRSYNGKHP